MLATIYISNETPGDMWVQSEVPGPMPSPPVVVRLTSGEWTKIYAIRTDEIRK